MARLTALALTAALRQPGRYHDGDGLMLLVRGKGAASWIARLQSGGRRREFGLGSVKYVSLSDAREQCRIYRRELKAGRDPLAMKPAEGLTKLFKPTALQFLEAKLNPAHRAKARRRLEMFVFPKLGKLMLLSIDADTVADCLRPIWTEKPVTALKCRNYIVRTLRFGREDGALLVGTLSRAISDRLPRQPSGKNHEAMPYREVPALMAKLEKKSGMGALALRAAILCANRSQEVRGATWDEIDWGGRVWNIPASRMKTRKPHRIPLSEQALAVFETAASLRRAETNLCFPSSRDGLLSDMAMTKCLRDLGETATQHGMRSCFKDWSREHTSFADEVSESALAHQLGSSVARAYLRSSFFDHRRELMSAWGAYCGGSAGADVVEMSARRA
jgi:integrase